MWLIFRYEFCTLCRIRVADAGGILCARCKGAAELELEKLLRDNSK
jgi:hypothetical protein